MSEQNLLKVALYLACDDVAKANFMNIDELYSTYCLLALRCLHGESHQLPSTLGLDEELKSSVQESMPELIEMGSH